jgi:site-specific DNA-cytosine methylase
MLALDEMGIAVEEYYASEVNKDAILVSKVHYGNIKHIGPVEGLSKEKLISLGRIDLLIGGSPCTELSLANPARKGLYGMYVLGKHAIE